jgi:hypothetical protein
MQKIKGEVVMKKVRSYVALFVFFACMVVGSFSTRSAFAVGKYAWLTVLAGSRGTITNAAGQTIQVSGTTFSGDMQVLEPPVQTPTVGSRVTYKVYSSSSFTYHHDSGEAAYFSVDSNNVMGTILSKTAKTITIAASNRETVVSLIGGSQNFYAHLYLEALGSGVSVWGVPDNGDVIFRGTPQGALLTGAKGEVYIESSAYSETASSIDKSLTVLPLADTLLISNITTKGSPLSVSGSVPLNTRLYPKIDNLRVYSTESGKSLVLSWNRVKKAKGYRVYKQDPKTKKWKVLKTISGINTNYFTDSQVSSDTVYTYKVASFKTVKNKKIFSKQSYSAKAITSSKTLANATKISVSKKETKTKQGKKVRVFAKLSSVKGKKLLSKSVAWFSTNNKIASVSKSGKVSKKHKGVCYIYARAHNGLASKRIKVIVK